MKNVIWKFLHDPVEIPSYFDHIEDLFDMHEVDDGVKAKLLLGNLNARAKTLTARLTRNQLDKYMYDDLKQFLLIEFKISPNSTSRAVLHVMKSADDSYNKIMYYLHSRQITNEFD